ncbi:MAG: AzlD domain-containing protein [Corynebacterium sp.]|nr:AzlD domain-containing protein [Corynebacterium sp.]
MNNYGLPEGMSLSYFLIVLIAIGAVTVALRAIPFVATRHLRQSQFLRFLGHYMPLGIMSILVVYTLLSTWEGHGPREALYGVGCIVFTLILHQWRRNALLSIFGGTLAYMALASLL